MLNETWNEHWELYSRQNYAEIIPSNLNGDEIHRLLDEEPASEEKHHNEMEHEKHGAKIHSCGKLDCYYNQLIFIEGKLKNYNKK